MFIVQLKFSENKANAKTYMEGHNKWIKQGFEDKVFILTGSIETGQGGAVIAHNVSLAQLEQRIKEDPFVTERVVEAEIIEVSPKKTDQRLNFLLAKA